MMLEAQTSPVLTLEEVADYLRLPRETVERQAAHGRLPGRRIEDTWRFLKAAIDDWLRGQGNRAVLLQQAGALHSDDTWPDLLETVFTQRGRPMAENADE